MISVHRSVLLKETIDGLNLKEDSCVLDATFGGGGHSKEILKQFPKSKIVTFDEDIGAWNRAKDKFIGFEERIYFRNKNFREIDDVDKFDGIIFDLGLSSDQLEISGRGFSFMKDEPLLMTMKENPSSENITAKDIVNDWSEKSLADIIYGYGEEQYAKKIAKSIVEVREKKIIETTKDLLEIIEKAVPGFYKRKKLHFATKTFQALRIAVNDELSSLKEGLENGFRALKKGGRMSVISFHSLEDRIVKNFFREKKEQDEAILINKKPILANNEELKTNIRARSAKLRILEKK